MLEAFGRMSRGGGALWDCVKLEGPSEWIISIKRLAVSLVLLWRPASEPAIDVASSSLASGRALRGKPSIDRARHHVAVRSSYEARAVEESRCRRQVRNPSEPHWLQLSHWGVSELQQWPSGVTIFSVISRHKICFSEKGGTLGAW